MIWLTALPTNTILARKINTEKHNRSQSNKEKNKFCIIRHLEAVQHWPNAQRRLVLAALIRPSLLRRAGEKKLF
jgi:hypothetical protein